MEEIVEQRAFGIDADHLDLRVLLLEILAGAGDGTAGAHAADKVGDSALGIPPDLRSRGFIMR